MLPLGQSDGLFRGQCTSGDGEPLAGNLRRQHLSAIAADRGGSTFAAFRVGQKDHTASPASAACMAWAISAIRSKLLKTRRSPLICALKTSQLLMPDCRGAPV